MKAFFFTEDQIANLVESIQRIEANYRNDFGGDVRRSSPADIASLVVKDLADNTPIQIDDTNINAIKEPCRYYPTSDIVGFAKNDGILKGVFIKGA